MQIENEGPISFPTLGRWALIKPLGEGATSKVFLAVDSRTKEVAAVKVFTPKNPFKLPSVDPVVRNEVSIIKSLDHSHIIAYKEFHDAIRYIDPDGPSFEVTALVEEFADGGDLFNLLKTYTLLPEVLARTYFHQILEGIEELHYQKIAHRDIKPENVMLDKNLCIKLADFGFSARFKSHAVLDRNAGTSKYFAPEMHCNLPYSGFLADLYAAAIVLFSMVAGHLPFNYAKIDDPVFSLLLGGQINQFWILHEDLSRRDTPFFHFDSLFKDFIYKMLHPNPMRRISVKEMKQHPWFKGDTIPKEKIAGFIRQLTPAPL